MAAHPILWPKHFFYPVGNTPAVCLTQDLPPWQAADVLLLGCGDPRSILYTVFADLKDPNSSEPRKLDITCCDIEPAILARNILLFSLIAEGIPSKKIWNIFYHFFLDSASAALLASHSRKLAGAAETLESWEKSAFGPYMKILTVHTLDALRQHWLNWTAFRELPSSRVTELRQEFLKLSRSAIEEREPRFSASRSAGPLWFEALDPVSGQFTEFWKTGTTFTSPEDVKAAKEMNPTFVYTLSGERFVPHYSTFPPMGFHLFPNFAPLREGSRANNRDVFAASQAQFTTWCSAFQRRISTHQETLCLRFYVGDALSFCRSLDIHNLGGGQSPGIQVRPWHNAAIQLDAYAEQASPTEFDIIDTSDLMDHLGLLNILLATRPLLKRDPEKQAIIYSEALLELGDDPIAALTDLLCLDIPSFAVLLNLAPKPYLSSFVTQSNSHDVFMMAADPNEDGRNRFRERIPWVRPASGDDHLVIMALMPVTLDPVQLAKLLFALHTNIFADKNLSKKMGARYPLRIIPISEDHYNCATFVALIRSVKGQVAITENNWDQVMDHFFSLIETDCRGPIRMNYYQELCTQMHLNGLHTVDILGPKWKTIARSVLSGAAPTLQVFESWINIPSVVCAVLVVPRDKMAIFESESDGTRGLEAHVHTTLGHDNVFSAFCVGRGSVVRLKEPGSIRIVESSPTNDDFIFSFYMPSWLLSLPETYIRLSVKLMPIASVRYTQELGSRLTVYQAPVTDRSRVFIARERPGLSGERHGLATLAGSLASRPGSQSETPIGISAQTDGPKISSFVARVDLKKLGVRRTLPKETPITAKQVGGCTMVLSVGDQKYLICYPYPIKGALNRLRVARTSGYVEVVTPLAGPGGYQANHFPVIRSPRPHPWNIHHLNLDLLPILDVSDPQKIDWVGVHTALQLSDRDRALRLGGDPDVTDVMMNIKDTINGLFTIFAGLRQGPRARVFGLGEPFAGDHTLIFMHGLRFDSASFTIVADVAILPIPLEDTGSLAMLFGRGLEMLRNSGETVISIITDFEEGTAWRQLIPAFIERCRTWTHKPTCEYAAPGAQIPLSVEINGVTLCSCGRGRDLPDAMWRNPGWRGLLPFTTRAAISPLFPVSYIEPVASDVTKLFREARGAAQAAASSTETSLEACAACGNPGKPKLLACGKCKRVSYCSSECQLKDWKAGHKKKCTKV